jgi:serine/threonine-protein kinase
MLQRPPGGEAGDASPVSENTPRLLGRYEIQEEIGRGMMGVVYRALDPALGRTVALKTVSLRWAVPADEREGFERRFQTEARVAAGLSHPGIVVVHDVGRDPDTDTLFIALEYLQGETLDERMRRQAPDWQEALRLTARLAEALDHAHERGVVHRDVKPANVMILATGEPKLMDFGIAKVPASQLTSAGEFFGTPAYMSPEQALGEPLDGRSDLFSLGSILYVLLTGKRAFEGSSVPVILARVAQHHPSSPSRERPGLPADVDYLVARCLAKDRGQRYPSGRLLAEDIEDVLAERAPRHRGEWSSPPVSADGTLTSSVHSPLGHLLETPPAAAAAPPPSAPAERHTLVGLTDRLGRRGLLVLAALLVIAVVAGALFRKPGPAGARVLPSLPLPTVAEPGHLDINFRHPLKSGTLKVWVDDDLVVEEALSARVTRRVLDFNIQRKGSVNQILDVAPGEHVVRVEVEGSGFSSSRRIRGIFKSGDTRHLDAEVGGLLKKELTLAWGS